MRTEAVSTTSCRSSPVATPMHFTQTARDTNITYITAVARGAQRCNSFLS